MLDQKAKTKIDNPDVKITLKQLEEMQKSGKVDLEVVGQYLNQNFNLDHELTYK